MRPEAIPRLPVFGWQAFDGQRAGGLPCMLDLPGLRYSTSGRAAILLALRALGVAPGDRVLLPTYHCPTMVAPVALLDATPVFYPIDAQGTPRLDWLDTQDLRGVRVMLAAHFFGLPQPMGNLRAWCSARNIALLEDCAHALFGSAGERPVGAWGDIAIGSLTKFLPVPEGGCLVLNTGSSVPPLSACGATTQIKAAIDIVEVGASQSQLGGLNRLIRGALAALRWLRGASAPMARAETAAVAEAGGDDFTIDAALAGRELAASCRWVAQSLPRQRIVKRRRQNYEWLCRRLAHCDGVRPLLPALPVGCAPYVFPLWVDQLDPSYAELRRLGMPVFRWDRHWPNLPMVAGDQGPLWSQHVLQMACHQDLQQADLEQFAATVIRLCSPADDGPGRRAAPTVAAAR